MVRHRLERPGQRLPLIRELKLGSEAFDMILMVLVYHDVYYVSESNPKHPEIDRDRFRCRGPAQLIR